MRHLKIALMIALVGPGLSAIEVQHRGAGMSDEYESADALLDKADSTFQSGDLANALQEYQRVLDLAQKEFNRSVETEALAQIARLLLKTDKKEEGRQWLERAGARADDSDPMGYSRYLGVKGRFDWQDNDLAAARKSFDEMYVYCNTNALWARAVDAAHMIAIVAEDPAEQIEWGRRGIEAAEAGGADRLLGPLWNNLAGSYFDIKQFDSALACYRRAREYHWQFSGELAKLFADYHVGMTYRLLGRFDEAESWLRPVLAWAERMGNNSAIGQACEDLGEIQAARGNKTGALKLLRRARDLYKAEGLDKSMPEVWENINTRIRQLEQ